jgi:hypothetical protein
MSVDLTELNDSLGERFLHRRDEVNILIGMTRRHMLKLHQAGLSAQQTLVQCAANDGSPPKVQNQASCIGGHDRHKLDFCADLYREI